MSTKIKLDRVMHTCHPSYMGRINKRIVVQASPSIKQDTISKITNMERADGMYYKKKKKRLPALAGN
jgi:hypothetical protein